MSKEMEELRRKFQERFGDGGDQVFQGVVTEVNEDEFTCTCLLYTSDAADEL